MTALRLIQGSKADIDDDLFVHDEDWHERRVATAFRSAIVEGGAVRAMQEMMPAILAMTELERKRSPAAAKSFVEGGVVSVANMLRKAERLQGEGQSCERVLSACAHLALTLRIVR